MTYRRKLTHRLNTPFQDFVLRMKIIATKAMKLGFGKTKAKDIASQLRADLDELIRTNPKAARQQWRRWYKANRRHQRVIGAYRRMGFRVGPTAHSLKREWVK